MGPIIIVIAAIVAFGVGLAGVMLATAWRRTERHNAALRSALSRIEQLERTMAAITFGQAPTPLAPPEPPAQTPPPQVSAPDTAAPISQQMPPKNVEPVAARVFAKPWRIAQTTGGAPPWLPLGGLALVAIGIGAARVAPGGLGGLAALVSAFVVAFGAVSLARRYGMAMIWLALCVGLAAPLLAPLNATTALARDGGLALLAALIAMSPAARSHTLFVWLAFGGAFAWGFKGALLAGPPFQIAIGGVCTAALGALAIVYAWDDSASPLPLTPSTLSGLLMGRPPRALVLGYVGVCAACAILACLVARNPDAAGAAAFGILLLASFCGFAGAYRPALGLTPALTAVAGATALLLWPAQADMRAALFVAGALAAAMIAAGLLMLDRNRRAGAALIALGPIAFVVAAQARAAALAQPWAWACAGLALSALCAFAVFRLRRAKPDAALLFTMGAALAMIAAIGFVIPAPWPPLGVELALPAIAWFGARDAGLRAALMVLAGFLLTQIMATSLGGAPQAIRIAIAAAAAVCAYFAARRLARIEPAWLSGQLAFVCSIGVAALSASLEVWRALGVSAGLALFDFGLQILIWLGAAYVLAREFGPKPHWLIRAIEATVFGAAAASAIVLSAAIINPWWGVRPALAPGWQGFNALSLAFLAPALAFSGYAWLWRRQSMRTRPKVALGVALALLVLYLSLEVRRAYHGPAMSQGGVGANEGWAYAIGALLIAAAGLSFNYRRLVLLWRPRPAKTLGDPNMTPPT